MADGDDSPILGSSPLAAEQERALLAQRQATLAMDPKNYEGMYGGLTRALAAGQANQTLAQVMPQLVAANQAAAPSLLRAMATANPWQTLAADPQATDVARARLAFQPPLSAVQASYYGAESEAARARAEEALASAHLNELLLQRRQQWIRAHGGGGAGAGGGGAGGSSSFTPGGNWHYQPPKPQGPAPVQTAASAEPPMI